MNIESVAYLLIIAYPDTALCAGPIRIPPVPNLSLTDTGVATLDVDAVIIGVLAGDSQNMPGPELAPGAAEVGHAFGGQLPATLRTLGARGAAEELTRVPAGGAITAPLVVAVGLGASPGSDAENLRRCAGAAVRSLAGTGRVGVALPAESADMVGAVAEGALLGAYSFLRYRDTSSSSYQPPVSEITVVSSLAGEEDGAVARARSLASSVALARDLVNTPPSDLHPQEFADLASGVADEAGLGIEVLDEEALRSGGYGGIVGVGQGSAHPPRLVRLSYTPAPQQPSGRTIAFVGKGITFDSGGLSLKPATSMEWMKSDMGGAAAVLGAMAAIADVRPAVSVVAYLALAENMPGGAAQRPSDVVTMYGGKTVEVLNTDAEGRLVMADAIVRAAADADLIVDAATLTGGQITALGTRVGGAMSNDDDLRMAVTAAATRAGDSFWPMPLPEELRKGLDSNVADIANISNDQAASMLTAGVFLQDFVPAEVRWAHLDIAGPAFNRGQPHGYTPKGGTGMATRTLVSIAEDASRGQL